MQLSVIQQEYKDMIDAAKAFLIDFESALKGTKNDMLNRMVEASVMMRREILCAEEAMEANQIFKDGPDFSELLRKSIKDTHELLYGDSV